MTTEPSPQPQQQKATDQTKPRRAKRRWLIVAASVLVVLVIIGVIVDANKNTTLTAAGPVARSANCVVSDIPPSVADKWLSPDNRSRASVVAVWNLTATEGMYTVVKLDNDFVLTFFNEPFGSGSTAGKTVDSITAEWSYFPAAESVTASSPGYAEARSCAL